MRRVLASAVAALALARAPLFADQFDDALLQAQAKLATPEGQSYSSSVAERFDEKKLRDALLDCAKTLPPEDNPPFTALLELTAEGRVTQVLLRPPAPVAVCLRWIIRETRMPRPPEGGYWVSVALSASRAAGLPVVPTPGVATATIPPTPTPPPPPRPAMPVAVPSPTPAPPLPGADTPFSGEGIHVDSQRPDLAALRRSLAASNAAGIGPLLAQSDGVAPDDARLEPYWSLAEELDRPIAIALGPAAPGDSSSSYRVALGDPVRLESVLVRHPRLRLVVLGGGWPFGDAMAGVMLRYPRVFVDLRPLTRALPDAEVQAYLRRLADAGFAARILSSSR